MASKLMTDSPSVLQEILKDVVLSATTKISFKSPDGITIGLNVSYSGSPEKLETLAFMPRYCQEILQTMYRESQELVPGKRPNFLKVRNLVRNCASELGMPIELYAEIVE